MTSLISHRNSIVTKLRSHLLVGFLCLVAPCWGALPYFSQGPQNQTAKDGGAAEFIAYFSTALNPVTIEWQSRPDINSGWQTAVGNVTNASGNSKLVLSSVSLPMSGTQVRCVISNGSGSATSLSATLSVTATAPWMRTDLQPQYLQLGDTAIFTADVAGTPPITYAWMKDGRLIPGATTPTLTISNVQNSDGGSYRVLANNALGPVTGASSANLYLPAQPIITTQPTSKSVGEGSFTSLEVTATGTELARYQWRKDGVEVPGATSRWLNFVAVKLSDAGTYTVEITSAVGSVTSKPATLTVCRPEYSDVQVGDQLVALGGAASISLRYPSSYPLISSYQWYRNGAAIPNATSSQYYVTNATLSDLGDYYAVIRASGRQLVTSTGRLQLNNRVAPLAFHWLDAVQADGVVHFLFGSPARIARYEISTRSWLPDWSLPETPVAFALAPEGWYVAYATTVRKYDRSFGGGSVLFTTPSTIAHAGIVGNYLIVTCSGSSWNFRCYRRDTGALVTQVSESRGPHSGFAYASTQGKFYGFADVLGDLVGRMSVDTDGNLGASGVSGTSAAQANLGRLCLLNNNSLLASTNGTVRDASSLAVVGQLGAPIEDVVDIPSGGFVGLQQGRAVIWDTAFREAASLQLGGYYRRLVLDGTTLHCFSQPSTAGENPSSRSIDITALGPTVDAAPVTARDTPVISPTITTDGEDIVYIYSKIHRNIFRWSAVTGDYMPAIGIGSSANHVVVQPETGSIYYELSPFQFQRRPLDGTTGSLPFFNSIRYPRSVHSAGESLVLATAASATDSDCRHIGVNRTGNLVAGPSYGSYRSAGSDWSPVTRNLFFLSSDITPRRLMREEVESTGRIIVPFKESTDLNDRESIILPIRLSPLGDYAALGGGLVYETAGMNRVQKLPYGLSDICWSNRRLYTVRNTDTGCVVESWTTGDWKRDKSATFAGNAVRLLTMRGDRLLLVTEQNNVLAYTLLDPVLLESTGASAPSRLEIVEQSGDIVAEPGKPYYAWVATSGGEMPSYQWQVRRAGTSTWENLNDDGNVFGARRGQLIIKQIDASLAGARFRVRATNASGTRSSDERNLALSGQAAIVDLVAGWGHVVFLRADGGAWAFGSNENYQLGDGTNYAASAPVLVAQQAASISAGYNFSGFAMRDGRFLESPRLPAPGPVATAVKAAKSQFCSLWLCRDGTVVDSNSRPIATGAVDIAVTQYCRLWIDTSGTLWRLGVFHSGTPSASDLIPQPVTTNVRSVFSDFNQAVLVLKRDGTLWSVAIDYTLTQIAADVVDAAAGAHWIFAKSDGTAWVKMNYGSGPLLTPPSKFADGILRVSPLALLSMDGRLLSLTFLSDGPKVSLIPLATGLPALVAPDAGPVSTQSISAGVAINWAPSTSSATWEIWRSATSDFGTAARIATTGATPFYIDATASIGTTYYYWIRSPLSSTISTSGAAGTRAAATLPQVTQQPTRTSSTSISIVATGDPWPTYSWEYQAPGSAWTKAPSSWESETPSLNTLYMYVPAGTLLRCKVSNSAGSVSSNAVAIEALGYTAPLLIISGPESTSVPFGTLTQFSVHTNLATSYQWLKDGILIPGANSPDLQVNVRSESDAGSYQVLVKRGNDQVLSSPAILKVVPAQPALFVAASARHTVFIMADGSTRSCGANQSGQLNPGGFGSDWVLDPRPFSDSLTSGIATGPFHTVAISPGGVYGAGSNSYGQRAGSSEYSGYFNGITTSRPVSVAVGDYHTLVLDHLGDAWAFGLNDRGQLGDGSTTNRSAPVKVMSGVRAIAAAGANSYFLDVNGALWGVGESADGQLGTVPSIAGAKVQLATSVRQFAAASRYITFVKTDGTLWCLGRNTGGQFGDAVALDSVSDAVQIASDVDRVAVGAAHLAFLKTDGSLWLVGDNTSGQLGTGDTAARQSPVRLVAAASAVACGDAHTVFIDEVGSIWGTGANDKYQLGFDTGGASVTLPRQLWSVMPASAAPAAPWNVIATASAAPSGAVVSWNPVVGASNYEVWRSTVPDFTQAQLLARTSVSSYFDTTPIAGETNYYWARATNAAGSGPFGNRVAIALGTSSSLPVITTHPASGTVAFGGSISFQVGASSSTGSLLYQWRKNGVPLPQAWTGSTTITLFSNVTADDAGDYDVVVSNSAGSVVSNAAKITIGPATQSLSSFWQPATRPFTTTPIQLSPTVTSAGLPVTFEVISGPAVITGSQLQLTGIGTVTLRATQAGDAYHTAVSATVTFAVVPAVLSPTLSALIQSYDGRPKNPSVSGLPDGVQYRTTYDASLNPPVTPGRYSVSVEVTTPNYQGTSTGILTILPGVQTISFTLPGHIYGPLNLQATSNTETPVNFAVTSGPATLTAARLVPTGLGAVTVEVSQAATANYDAAVVVRTTEVLFGFPSWQALHFSAAELDHPEVSGPEGDPDADGLNNLLEYALGLDPRQISAEWNTMRCENGDWVFTYSRPSERSDLIYTVETSSSLQTWSTDSLIHTRVTTSDGIETWEARRPVSAGSTSFFRLKISHQ